MQEKRGRPPWPGVAARPELQRARRRFTRRDVSFSSKDPISMRLVLRRAVYQDTLRQRRAITDSLVRELSTPSPFPRAIPPSPRRVDED